MNDDSERTLVIIATFPFLYQADAARLHLSENGIPSYLANEGVMQMNWLLGQAVGHVQLLVADSDVAKANAVLTTFSQPTSEDTCLACGAAMQEEETICPQCGWSFGSGEEAAEDD